MVSKSSLCLFKLNIYKTALKFESGGCTFGPYTLAEPQLGLLVPLITPALLSSLSELVIPVVSACFLIKEEISSC